MHNVLISITIILSCIFLYTIIEILIIRNNGTYVPAPEIPRTPQTFGLHQEQKLTFVVLGDSTTIGQGAKYNDSYPFHAATHLSSTHQVRFINLGVSGAKIEDVVHDQLPQAVSYKPDLVLLGVGANDTTHFTSLVTIRSYLESVIAQLRNVNPDVKIVATRSPALDSVSRFPLVSKYILRLQTARVNKVFDEIIKKHDITPALIAERTRDAFLADPTLTAEDNFHPNKRGYALWIPIINAALDEALTRKQES